jgi:hypothetical protein
MSRNSKKTHFTIRLAAALAVLGMAGFACADLKFNVSVQATGKTSQGTPRSGQYVVEFRSGAARVEAPDGKVRLFDFTTSKVADLDPSTKTYTVLSMTEALGGGGAAVQSASLKDDATVKSGIAFGVKTKRLIIDLGTASALAEAKIEPTKSKEPTDTGFAWVADGSKVSTDVGSVAPLVTIGVPRALAYSMTQSLDGQSAIPVWISFTWSSGATLEMTVDSIESTTLADSLFTIPAKYKPATPPAKG